MKILIFAGGSGTRLWPLSRKKLPKQFKKIFDGKSTIQLAFERVEKTFGNHNIYVSTNEGYISLVKDQIPQLPASNIVGEPVKRDLAAAIGYNFVRLKKKGYNGPVAILWADHLMKNVDSFLEVLKKGEVLLTEDSDRFVFIGERPRYAENNLGWIHVGEDLDDGSLSFIEWIYKPSTERCDEIFESGEWLWNPGYFIVDLDFVLGLYEELMPDMYSQLMVIAESIGTVRESDVLEEIYPQMESISFDKAIIEKVPPEKAVVLRTDMGWADPGTLYALKEALVGNNGKNLSKGLTYELDTSDSVVINEESSKLVATVGLENMIVVNTKDALLVVHKDDVVNISGLVKTLGKDPVLKEFI
jgi:mannose-1-phosphate guanylyltransferase